MSIRLYDEALVSKLKQWTQGIDVHIYSPDDTRRLFEVIADTSNDEPLKLPIICLRRDPTVTIINKNKRPLTFDGITKDATYEKSLLINAIPISIGYQLDIYTRYLSECDELSRNFVYHLINFPRVRVNIPYENDFLEHDSSLHLTGDIQDNSNIQERLITGQFTRFTLTFSVDDAYLWDIRARDNYSFECDEVEVSEDEL